MNRTIKPKDQWKVRRRIIILTLLFCAVGIIYLTVWGSDTTLNQTLTYGFFGLFGSTLGSYVFGATWEDVRNHQD